MDDKQIVDLYWERSEDAIAVTQEKYGRYCYSVAYNILRAERDAEECVNDTYVSAWNAMPPHRPNVLSTFLGKLTRNISLNRFYHENAMKRNLAIEVVLDEVQEFIPADNAADPVGEHTALKDTINRFLESLSKQNRIIFVRRYWYLSPISAIADDCGLTEGNVKVRLVRLRRRFKLFLEKEGIHI